MDIKTKLRGLMGLVLALPAFYVGFATLNAVRALRQVEVAGEALDDLYAAARVRSNIDRQMMEVIEVFLTADAEDRAEYDLYEHAARQALNAWLDASEALLERGVAGARENVAEVKELLTLYDQVSETLDRAFEVMERRDQDAVVAMADTLEILIEDNLATVMHEIVMHDRRVAEEEYDRLLLYVSSLLWTDERSWTLVQGAQRALHKFVLAEEVHSSILRQVKEVEDLLLTGDPEDKTEHDIYGYRARQALNAWIDASTRSEEEGVEGEALDVERAYEAERIYDEALELIRSSLALADPKETIKRVAEDVQLVVDDSLLPLLREAMDDERGEIIEAHRDLSAFTKAAAWLGIGITTVLSLLFAFFTLRLLRSILTSLATLGRGVEKISAGDLAHRIDLTRRDELGRLASSFNLMSESLEARNAGLLEREEQIQQLNQHLQKNADDLEAANHELEAFAYSVSHDLRSPLRAIDGFAEALAEDYGQDLPPDASEYLDLVQKNARHMGQLIDDLLTFSRLGHQPLKTRRVDVAALAREVLNSLLSNHDDAPRVEIGELPPCQADPALLRQVLTNLLSNALKFSRERPTPRIEVGAMQQAAETVYYVRDNGVGFEMAYADKLFGVFERLHLAEEYEGTGVGLAVAKRIIDRHGGRIWAEAALDEGATFYFTLRS